ncbi:MAG: twin-arginine translocation signal domain-containing protein, partial [Atopobiaceae bacterium]|nr:twin-arginine translocation signal domain-containing protein [Atopobiaceae bacterium]
MDKNAISRRTFLEMVGALGAAGALTACGSQRASETTGDEGGEGGEFADTITFSQGADPRGLDPAFVDDMESAQVMTHIYETLLA